MDKRIKNYPEAISLYKSGLSVQDVAEFYGVTRQAMWVWLKRRGVKFRPNAPTGQENHFHRNGKRNHKNANRIVERAVRKGILVRPGACQMCFKLCVSANGRPGIEAHHDDYNKPLEVRWLCRKCHFQWHKENRAISISS